MQLILELTNTEPTSFICDTFPNISTSKAIIKNQTHQNFYSMAIFLKWNWLKQSFILKRYMCFVFRLLHYNEEGKRLCRFVAFRKINVGELAYW